ncbi:unnamed protein product, partial [Urochloa humidicola]
HLIHPTTQLSRSVARSARRRPPLRAAGRRIISPARVAHGPSVASPEHASAAPSVPPTPIASMEEPHIQSSDPWQPGVPFPSMLNLLES